MSINSKVHELRELRQMAEELEAEIETIEDSIKEQMRAQGVDTLHGPDWNEKSSHIPAAKQEDMEA